MRPQHIPAILRACRRTHKKDQRKSTGRHKDAAAWIAHNKQANKGITGEIEAKAEKLDTINYSVFKLKLRFGEIVPTLRGIQTELNKLKTIQTDLKNVGLSLTELGNVQHHDLNSVNEEITILAGEIEWLLFLLL